MKCIYQNWIKNWFENYAIHIASYPLSTRLSLQRDILYYCCRHPAITSYCPICDIKNAVYAGDPERRFYLGT